MAVMTARVFETARDNRLRLLVNVVRSLCTFKIATALMRCTPEALLIAHTQMPIAVHAGLAEMYPSDDLARESVAIGSCASTITAVGAGWRIPGETHASVMEALNAALESASVAPGFSCAAPVLKPLITVLSDIHALSGIPALKFDLSASTQDIVDAEGERFKAAINSMLVPCRNLRFAFDSFKRELAFADANQTADLMAMADTPASCHSWARFDTKTMHQWYDATQNIGASLERCCSDGDCGRDISGH